MKVRIVATSEIAAAGGRLDARFYVDPTAETDREIDSKEKKIRKAEADLDLLRAKRKEILKKVEEKDLRVAEMMKGSAK